MYIYILMNAHYEDYEAERVNLVNAYYSQEDALADANSINLLVKKWAYLNHLPDRFNREHDINVKVRQIRKIDPNFSAWKDHNYYWYIAEVGFKDESILKTFSNIS